jgi:hypothetical protein
MQIDSSRSSKTREQNYTAPFLQPGQAKEVHLPAVSHLLAQAQAPLPVPAAARANLSLAINMAHLVLRKR